jgi:hypothetical protein
MAAYMTHGESDRAGIINYTLLQALNVGQRR